MGYLIQTLFFPWLLLTLVAGIAIGWITCERNASNWLSGWVPFGLVAFFIGLVAAMLQWFPGRAGLWLDTALLFFATYIIGCCIGCLARQYLGDQLAFPAAAAAVGGAAYASLESAADAAHPRVNPYQWQATRDGNALTLSGFVSSEAARKYFVDRAKAAIPSATVTDQMKLANGAPTNEAGMVDAALSHLSMLDHGTASLVDKTYTLHGTAKSGGDYASLIGKVKLLSHGFTLGRADISAPGARAAAASASTEMVATEVSNAQTATVRSTQDVAGAAKATSAVRAVAPVAAPIVSTPVGGVGAGVLGASGAVAAQVKTGLVRSTHDVAGADKATSMVVPVARAVPPEPAAAPPVENEGSYQGTRPKGYASPRGGNADDLKRIRGIGKQNEGRLHALGIWHFDQIAAWTLDEVKWIGSYLAFPGRIEREDWLAQAKILATGADTEFSKRVARGEVATSKDDGTLGQGNVAQLKDKP